MVPNHQPAILLVLCWSQLTVTGAYRGTWAEGARSESFPQLLGCWSTLGGQVRTKRDCFLHGFFGLGSEKMDGFPHVFQASSFSIFSISLFGGCVNWKTHIAFFGFSRTWNLPAPCPKIKPLNYLTKVCKQPEVFQHVQASFFSQLEDQPTIFLTIGKGQSQRDGRLQDIFLIHLQVSLQVAIFLTENPLGKEWDPLDLWPSMGSWYQSGEGEIFGEEEPIAHLVSSWYRIAQLGDSCCEKQWLQEFAGTAKLGWEKRWSDWCFC